MFYDMTYVFEGLFWLLCRKKKDRRARTEAGRIVWRQLQESRRKTQRRHWHPTPVLLPGKCHGRRSLVGYSLWGREESETTE